MNNIKHTVIIAVSNILILFCIFYFQWDFFERRLFRYLINFLVGYVIISVILFLISLVFKNRKLIIFWVILVPFISVGVSLNCVVLIFSPHPYQWISLVIYFSWGFIMTQAWIVSIINGILAFFLVNQTT